MTNTEPCREPGRCLVPIEVETIDDGAETQPCWNPMPCKDHSR